MPATIVVVLDDQAAREAAERALRVAGLDVATFTDSIIALEAIEKSGKTRIVVCPVTSGRGTLTGVALLRMLRRRQLIRHAALLPRRGRPARAARCIAPGSVLYAPPSLPGRDGIAPGYARKPRASSHRE